MKNKQLESIYFKGYRLLEKPLTDSERSLLQEYLKLIKNEFERLEKELLSYKKGEGYD